MEIELNVNTIHSSVASLYSLLSSNPRSKRALYARGISFVVIVWFIIHIFIRIRQGEQGVPNSNLSSTDACLIAPSENLFLVDVSSPTDCCLVRKGRLDNTKIECVLPSIERLRAALAGMDSADQLLMLSCYSSLMKTLAGNDAHLPKYVLWARIDWYVKVSDMVVFWQWFLLGSVHHNHSQ